MWRRKRRRATGAEKRIPRSDELSLLGLAQRAGAVEAGSERAKRAIRSGTARLVVLAEDASPGQRSKVERLAHHREVPVMELATRAVLGGCLGAPPVSAIAVTGASFAERLLKLQQASGADGLPGRGAS